MTPTAAMMLSVGRSDGRALLEDDKESLADRAASSAAA